VCGVTIGALLVFLILTPLLNQYPIDVAFGGLSLVHSSTAVAVGIMSLMVTGLIAGYLPARIVAKEEILKAIWG
jgi:ABC-type antimicrobial peptide transport system permease subunit